MELMQASRQWASRPNDERFVNLYEMAAKVAYQHDTSRAITVATKDLKVVADQTDVKMGLQVVGPNGHPVNPTNWSFGQLASLAGAPAGYLRKLDARLVADNMNYGLDNLRNVENVGVLLTRESGQNTMRAATGPNYGRIWNKDIVEALIDKHGDGVSGRFRVPGEFKKAVEVTKANTTLYAGDRDMFVFLADEENRIEVPNRRDGKSGSLAKGFFVWNSEVGSSSVGGAFFLFDEVCKNRIVWGAQDFKEIRISHTASAPHRWVEEINPILIEYVNSETKTVTETIRAAQQKRIDDKLDTFFANRQFNGAQITQIKAAHEAEEGRPIETIWDAVTGVTAFAKTIEHQDSRVAIERMGGKLLDLVAA